MHMFCSFPIFRQAVGFVIKPLHIGIAVAMLSSVSVSATAASSKTTNWQANDSHLARPTMTNATLVSGHDNTANNTDNIHAVNKAELIATSTTSPVLVPTPINPMPILVTTAETETPAKYDPMIANGVPLPPTYPVDVPQYMTLEQAQQSFVKVSPKVAADNAAIVNREKMAESTKNLDKPVVYVGASAMHLHADADISTSNIKNKVANDINTQLATLPVPLPLPMPLPDSDIGGLITDPLPDNIPVDIDKNTAGANVTVLWSAYNGGKTQAITDLLNGRTSESRADADISLDEQYTTLTKRYFSTQLAIMAAYLRADALNAIRQTDHAAQRALDVGLISEVERLEAKNALANAEYENAKAQNDAELAMTALQRMLRTNYSIKPTNPLFVSSKPLPPLSYFQQVAKTHHPAFDKVAAKYQQAEALHTFSESNYKPTVTVFGRQGITNNGSNWVAGVAANWKLWGGIDREASSQASEAQLYQAQFSQIDVEDNLMLLVEKNWQTLKNAQRNFLSLNTNIKLASEMVRFRQLGLQEGVSTATEVIQAQANLEKAKTEQARAANDYVQALADLMQSCGTPLDFNQYMQAADLELPAIFFEHNQTDDNTDTPNTASSQSKAASSRPLAAMTDNSPNTMVNRSILKASTSKTNRNKTKATNAKNTAKQHNKAGKSNAKKTKSR